MMRINLLPPYIYDKQKKMVIAATWSAAVVLVLVGFLLWAGNVSSQLDEAKGLRDKADQYSKSWDASEQKIKNIQAATAATKTKIEFVQNAIAWNNEWPKLMEFARSWTADSVTLQSVALDKDKRQTLTMNAFCQGKDPDGRDAERSIVAWWMLLRNSGQFTSVNIPLQKHGFGVDQGGNGGGNNQAGGMGQQSQNRQQQSGPQSGPSGNNNQGNRGTSTGGTTFTPGVTELVGRRGVNFTVTAVMKEQFLKGASAPSWAGGASAGGGAPGGAGTAGAARPGVKPGSNAD